jgi:hypothetical protein
MNVIMTAQVRRKLLMTTFALPAFYIFVYLVCSLFGTYSWIYGNHASPDGYTHWDGIGYVPLFFPGGQDQFVNRIYSPLLEFDRHHVHDHPEKILGRTPVNK